MSPSPLTLIAVVSNNSWSVYNFRMPVIRWLQAQGFRILVIAPEDAFSQLLVEEGCLFEPVKFNNRSVSPWADFQYYRQLKSLYASYRPALIFHYVVKPNIYGSIAARSQQIPSVAVITGLGYAFDKRNWLNLLVKSLYRFALKKSSAVWFLNKEDARVFISEKLVAPDKCAVLPGEGVDTNYYNRSSAIDQHRSEDFTFLMSCRLLQSKGIGIYAAAAAILQAKGYRFRCLLIGDFENRHPDNILPEQLKQWQEDGLIQYLGFTNDVRPFLEAADCAVLPSYYHEGIPRSLMEAASMQLPLITSDSSGCRELVENEATGFLCRQKDAADLAMQMEKMINLSSEIRQLMGRHGRELMIAKFDISQVIAIYAKVISAFI